MKRMCLSLMAALMMGSVALTSFESQAGVSVEIGIGGGYYAPEWCRWDYFNPVCAGYWGGYYGNDYPRYRKKHRWHKRDRWERRDRRDHDRGDRRGGKWKKRRN